MTLARTLDGPGTDEFQWRRAAPTSQLPLFDSGDTRIGRVVVVAPHPDDEILGVGGTVARLGRRGIPLVHVAVTDGEASHAGRAEELRQKRPLESAAAAAVLGINPTVIRLGLADGVVEDRVVSVLLGPMLRPGDLVLAPWARDGHPDHEAVGRAVAAVAPRTGAARLDYLVWAWHWAMPAELPWERAVRSDLGRDLARRKRRAIACFRSQTDGDEPILPLQVLRYFTRPFEVLLRP